MKAKKIGVWLFDTTVFVIIAVYRSIVGYTDSHYFFDTDSWVPSYSDVYYLGSSNVSVYDEPFFIVCMIVIALYLLVSLVLKIKGTDGDGTLALKLFAYIAALVSVTYMYSGSWDWLIVVIIGIVSLVIEASIRDKKKA